MAAKVKVEVLDAVIDGKSKGAEIEISERSAKYLESIGYVRVLTSEKASSEKGKGKKTSALKKGGAKTEKSSKK